MNPVQALSSAYAATCDAPDNAIRAISRDIKPGDVVTIKGVRNVNGLKGMVRTFVVVKADPTGAVLDVISAAGKVRSVPVHRVQSWPLHHKRDRWA